MEAKKWYLSKTFWFNVIIAVLAAIPTVRDFIISNPEMVVWFWAAINMVLRFVSKGKIQLTE